jgi:EAL domain-containing protein (putative c-di-GMP-specific phosphodiesterase class I)
MGDPSLPEDGGAGPAWYLETHLDGGRLWRVPLRPLPFRVGRREGLQLMVPSDAVSSEHAEIRGAEGDHLRLCDLGSTNGTFINRERIEGERPLSDGDIVHFADFEFRVTREAKEHRDRRHTAVLGDARLPESFLPGTRELTELLRDRAVASVFQPIVEMSGRTLVAVEALGRGAHPDLPEPPTELFRIAATVGLEVELSRIFRLATIESLNAYRRLPPIFLNTHPAELGRPELIQSLADLQRVAPHVDMVVEVHERFFADTNALASLRESLAEIDIRLAYDDFGVGQARLLELAEVPPDFLKFDVSFIRGIDSAPAAKRRLLTALVAAARDLEIVTIAEGVETEAEYQVCLDAGFTQGQGYFFGRPAYLADLDFAPEGGGESS